MSDKIMRDVIVEEIVNIPTKRHSIEEEIDLLSQLLQLSLYNAIIGINKRIVDFGYAEYVVPTGIVDLLVNIYECRGYNIVAVLDKEKDTYTLTIR